MPKVLKEKAMRPKQDSPFIWNPRNWRVKDKFSSQAVVTRMVPKESFESPLKSVIKKVARMEELRHLKSLPSCNRILKPLVSLPNQPKARRATMIFEDYVLGDLQLWRDKTFSQEGKPIPEAHLWRLFVHMTQALAMVHGIVGPLREEEWTLLHRDIKPENIMVADNGTAYPSFKLTDFGLAKKTIDGSDDADKESFLGTYSWQAPENPYINTTSAEIWALGACIHYLAFGDYMFKRMIDDWLDELDEDDRAKAVAVRGTYDNDKACRAKNPYCWETDPKPYKPHYSDRLNYWMMKCLRQDPSARPSVPRLWNKMIPDARVALLELNSESENVMEDLTLRYE